MKDIATVDILERAEGVDPSGERTIGVLTKSDLIGAGGEDEIVEVVNNRRKPLALGYTMLKNRSQKDIKDGVSTGKARLMQQLLLYLLYIYFFDLLLLFRENELSFFTGHPVFKELNPTLFGVEQLSKKLTTVLVTKIKQELVSYLIIM